MLNRHWGAEAWKGSLGSSSKEGRQQWKRREGWDGHYGVAVWCMPVNFCAQFVASKHSFMSNLSPQGAPCRYRWLVSFAQCLYFPICLWHVGQHHRDFAARYKSEHAAYVVRMEFRMVWGQLQGLLLIWYLIVNISKYILTKLRTNVP